jgi:hypothetical protein
MLLCERNSNFQIKIICVVMLIFPIIWVFSPNCTLKDFPILFFPVTIPNIHQKTNNFTGLDPILLMCYFGSGTGEKKKRFVIHSVFIFIFVISKFLVKFSP